MRPILVLSCAVVISSAMLLHSWGADERGFSICEEFDLSYFPEPASERALLALALMREGRGLNHPAYAFLSFFRVLEDESVGSG